MGVLDRFEKGVERALSSTFARAFKADLKPVDIASALRAEMDNRTASLSRGRTVVPNRFTVELGSADLQKVEQWGESELVDDLVRTATHHATDQGYVFVGPVSVELQEVSDFKAGEFTIRSSSQQVGIDEPIYRDQRSARSEEPVMDQPDAPRPQRPTVLSAQPILDVDGQRYLLTGPVTVLGRGREADITVSDNGVSRQHLEIRITEEGVVATDLGSTNGTFVEGHRVDAATLVNGNTVTIGRTRITFWAGNSGSGDASGDVE